MSTGPHLRAKTAMVLALILVPLVGTSPAQAGFLSCFCPCGWAWAGAAVVGGFLMSQVSLDNPCTANGTSLSVTLVPSSSTVNPHDGFDVAIMGDITQEVVSYGFHMSYDTSLLSLDSLTVAPAFTSSYSPRSDGIVATAYPTTAVGDDVLLATAHFTALSLGTASIGIEATPGDPLEGFAQRSCGYASMTVTPTLVTIVEPETHPVVPTPEPATILVMAGGMGLMWRPRRRPR